MFLEWRCAWSEIFSDQKCPKDLFKKPDTTSLNYWIPHFVADARKQGGKTYRAKTIHQLLVGLQRCMLEKNPLAPTFLSNPRFSNSHRACDSTYHEWRQQGVGTKIRHAAVISGQDENKLRSISVIGAERPAFREQFFFFRNWTRILINLYLV